MKFFAPNSAECEFYKEPPPTDYPKDKPGIYSYDAYRVWVQNNCRATFEVCLAGKDFTLCIRMGTDLISVFHEMLFASLFSEYFFLRGIPVRKSRIEMAWIV